MVSKPYGNVSAIIVTKGDRDLEHILSELPFRDIVVWDNSKEHEDQKIYGRYLAATRCKNELLYVQDDDCVVDVSAVVTEYTPGAVVCNMPRNRRREYYDGIQLVGWGAVFHKNLIEAAFSEYLYRFPKDELFLRECDRVFTYLNRCVLLDVPFTQFDYAFGQDRMGTEKRHGDDMKEIRRRLHTIVRKF